MPIVVRPEPNEPLCQGDILRQVPVFVTGIDGAPQADPRARYVMVVSRPCKALRDTHVVVAPIFNYKLDVSALVKGDDPTSLDKHRRILAGLRDGISGGAFADALYLGTLEGSTSRFAAQLSTLHTVSVPEAKAGREAWIEERRVGRLSPDFVRDLHVRTTLSFQKLGFDDYSAYCDADLELIVNAGRKEINQREATALSARESLQNKQASGDAVSANQRTALEGTEADVEEAKGRLQPYLDELNRRKISTA